MGEVKYMIVIQFVLDEVQEVIPLEGAEVALVLPNLKLVMLERALVKFLSFLLGFYDIKFSMAQFSRLTHIERAKMIYNLLNELGWMEAEASCLPMPGGTMFVVFLRFRDAKLIAFKKKVLTFALKKMGAPEVVVEKEGMVRVAWRLQFSPSRRIIDTFLVFEFSGGRDFFYVLAQTPGGVLVSSYSFLRDENMARALIRMVREVSVISNAKIPISGALADLKSRGEREKIFLLQEGIFDAVEFLEKVDYRLGREISKIVRKGEDQNDKEEEEISINPKEELIVPDERI